MECATLQPETKSGTFRTPATAADSDQVWPNSSPPRSSTGLRQASTSFQGPQLRHSLGQIASTAGPLIALWAAMYVSLEITYWLTLLLALPAAAFVVRLFIIQHDCGHHSFFTSRRLNDVLGRLCSLATLTPYRHWRRQHNSHHAHWNNLGRRDRGVDIYWTCLTVAEYRALSGTRRFFYRLLRHPVVAFVLVPPLVFLVLYRLPFDTPAAWRSERRSVHLTNLMLATTVVAVGAVVGFWQLILVQVPITVAASIIGVWLFSVQHKFERTTWYRSELWNADAASLQGSSYLHLPRVLQWLTGNIGLHHVHHLNPRIPNYRLGECLAALPRLQEATTLTITDALKTCRLWLWDEQRQRMVGFDSRHPH